MNINWTVLVAYCIIDDLLKILGHRDDPQSKTPASVVLTLWVLAALAFGGKHKLALAYAEEQALFSFIPSRSRFSRRLPLDTTAVAVGQGYMGAALLGRALHPRYPTAAGL